MYLVVSVWEPLPGKEAEFRERGLQIGAILKRQSGVELLEVFHSEGKAVSVHGYADEATYHRLVDDPNGPFMTALAEYNAEEYGRWISSQRGQAEVIA